MREWFRFMPLSTEQRGSREQYTHHVMIIVLVIVLKSLKQEVVHAAGVTLYLQASILGQCFIILIIS